jgi:hypothetical protein
VLRAPCAASHLHLSSLTHSPTRFCNSSQCDRLNAACSAQAKSLRPPASTGSADYEREAFEHAEVEWRVVHASFAQLLENMQLMTQLVCESHVSQQLATRRCVQRETVLRLLVQAQLQEREATDAARAEGHKLLEQKHQELTQRFLELSEALHTYA